MIHYRVNILFQNFKTIVKNVHFFVYNSKCARATLNKVSNDGDLGFNVCNFSLNGSGALTYSIFIVKQQVSNAVLIISAYNQHLPFNLLFYEAPIRLLAKLISYLYFTKS